MRSSRLRPGIPDRFPHLHRRDRGLDRGNAEISQRVYHAVGDAGRTPDRAGLAASLGAERIGAAWRGAIQSDLDRRHVVGARDTVVLIARSEKQTNNTKKHTHKKRLADALRDAAMH